MQQSNNWQSLMPTGLPPIKEVMGGKVHRLSGEAILRRDMLDMVKARCRAAGLSEEFCNHTFRGTGMTVFLQNGGSLGSGTGHGESRGPAHHEAPRPS
jgi:hypothetical protein